ncbi:MAG: hypothetical protein AAB337_01020 [Patescibacteria group bacterium]
MKTKVDVFRIFIRHNASSVITELAERFTRVREEIYTDSAGESCKLLERVFARMSHDMRGVKVVPCAGLFDKDFLPLVVYAGSDKIRIAMTSSCEVADILLCIHHQ